MSESFKTHGRFIPLEIIRAVAESFMRDMQPGGLKVGNGIILTLQHGLLRLLRCQVALNGFFHEVMSGALLDHCQ
ncbi:MAG: hypothetical protein COW02_07420 [Comamonadaceae bacterium CG12_big_fil_rev_8_21_14_0_65_59_15]|nr:MAG: hypothetical protein COW02_07420 [Comamonadaceae bacterium CG12_big_fil_rev_8_21_14_0_65_59_15]